VTDHASRRSRAALAHHPGLDGLRGLAVAAVLLYHGGVSFAPGGFLGVEVFFVLSGFLITSLLLAEWRRTATIALREFWARRARRLLPALFCVVCAVGVYYALAGSTDVIPGLKGDGIAAVLYVSNWHQIAAGANYFAASGPVSPLQHTWSLAIEEQFYLVWPVLACGLMWLVYRRGRSQARTLQALLAVTVTGAVASAVDAAVLFDGGTGLNRVYMGTDTRAFGLLIGASLAIGLSLAGRAPAEGRATRSPLLARALRWATALILAAVLAAIAVVPGTAGWVYPYGLLALDALVAALIVVIVRCPRALAARALAVRPLTALGTISYGVYLWHFPLFQWLNTGTTELTGAALLGARLGVTLAVSIASYVVIEQPIRRRRIPAWLVRGLTPIALGGAIASLVVAAGASALPTSVPAAATVPSAPAQLSGTGPACSVSLRDTKQYGLSPLGASDEAKFEYAALGASKVTWTGSSTKTFDTCPPKKVMVIGDSLAFTLGVPMMSNEQNYGLEVANASLLGCSFTAKGQLNVNGTWENQPAGCPGALQQWSHDEQTLHPQEVVVELGYRDEFDWRIDGKVQHLGQAGFDAYVQSQIDRYVKALGGNGTKVLFLSVPYTHPPDLANGSPAPAASRSRHALINSMLEKAARQNPTKVAFLDLDKTVSPDNRYTEKVDGQVCRFDGIHFSVYCSELLEPQVLGEVRKMTG
jgi:peptidoglycan/LPS O-acetylase OafA/YrhL